jgi:GNAT superfamily N-acetyltransferase
METLNYSLTQNNFKFDCVEGNISDNRTIKRNKGKIILDETIRSITYNFFCHEFYLQFVPYDNEIHLHQIRVNPLFQKNGLGKRLMEIITDVSTFLNINVSLIPVSMDGIIPIEKLENFYSKCGFILDEETYHWNYLSQRGNVINLNQQYEYRMVG